MNVDYYPTTDTPMAIFLIHSNHVLNHIEYEDKPDGRTQATYLFVKTDGLLEDVNIFSRGDAEINIARYEHIRSSLLDRIMRRLP